MSTAKRNLVIDIVALAIYLIVANPAVTGIRIHEWLGLGLLVVFLIHFIVHFDWMVDTLRDFFTKPTFSRQGNLIVNCLILVVFMIAIVSGFGISGAVLLDFGLYAEGYYFWGPLHSVSAKLLLALLVIHMVVHWKWMFSVIRGEKDEDNDKETRNAWK